MAKKLKPGIDFAHYRIGKKLGAGDKDQAFAWLERGYEEHSFQMKWLKVEPRWDPLRAEPRFKELLRKVGLPE